VVRAIRGFGVFVPSAREIGPQVLAGIRVLEIGQLIAGPFCGKTLGDFGADVIKIEPPGLDDPLRKWRTLKNGTSLWWQVQSRNKRSVTADLRTQQGQSIARALASEADILIENFKPGTMEEWGLGWESLSGINPALIMLRISGYGQDGPYRDRPGFGVVAEAMGGVRYLTGEPGRTSVRTGISLGNTLAALHGTLGVLLALYHRKVNGGAGQVIDVALYEAVFNCTESLLPEFSAAGVIRQPSGSALPGIAPTNAYTCNDGTVIIAGNGDSIFKRLMTAIDRPDLHDNADLASNEGRVKRVDEIDQAISAWTGAFTVSKALDILSRANVPASRIYTVKDIAADPHYEARGMIQRVHTREGFDVDMPGIVPKLSATPGVIRSSAPLLGEHTREVLLAQGFDAAQLDLFASKAII
jgi:formyl-CoA transferase